MIHIKLSLPWLKEHTQNIYEELKNFNRSWFEFDKEAFQGASRPTRATEGKSMLAALQFSTLSNQTQKTAI